MAENLMQLSRMYSEYTDSQIQLHCTVLPDARHIHLCFQDRNSIDWLTDDYHCSVRAMADAVQALRPSCTIEFGDRKMSNKALEKASDSILRLGFAL